MTVGSVNSWIKMDDDMTAYQRFLTVVSPDKGILTVVKDVELTFAIYPSR